MSKPSISAVYKQKRQCCMRSIVFSRRLTLFTLHALELGDSQFSLVAILDADTRQWYPLYRGMEYRVSPSASMLVYKMANSTKSSRKTVKKWSQKYKDEYAETWPFISSSRKRIYYAHCNTCNADISIEHGGRDDIRRHLASKKHADFEA